MNELDATPAASRRRFIKKIFVTFIGGLLGLVPIGAGLGVFFDPLRRKGGTGTLVRITSLDALPADGVPRSFPVIASRQDAWITYAATSLGVVFLRRTSETTIQAFTATCPHAGCHVQYQAERHGFLCPCHKGSFTVDGQIANPKSPAPRGLDALEVQIRGDNAVWVRFQRFQPGRPEKVPVA